MRIQRTSGGTARRSIPSPCANRSRTCSNHCPKGSVPAFRHRRSQVSANGLNTKIERLFHVAERTLGRLKRASMRLLGLALGHGCPCRDSVNRNCRRFDSPKQSPQTHCADGIPHILPRINWVINREIHLPLRTPDLARTTITYPR